MSKSHYLRKLPVGVMSKFETVSGPTSRFSTTRDDRRYKSAARIVAPMAL